MLYTNITCVIFRTATFTEDWVVNSDGDHPN